ncbi:MAG: hypothetical protein KC503_03925 [Myxococcales bacterium]|nr:hypothetical protein [Myxococcales bacterium]
MRSPTAVLVMATAAALAPGCGYSWKQGKRTFPPTVCVREKSWTTTGLVYIGTLTFRSGNVDANAFGRRHGADVATVRNLGGGGSYTNTLIFSNGAAITHHGSVAGKVAVTFYRQTHFRFHKGHENERPPWYKRHFACPAGTRMVCGHLEQYCATKKFGVRMGPRMRWHANGQVSLVERYRLGPVDEHVVPKLVGPVRLWYSNGQKQMVYVARGDEPPCGAKCWMRDGKLVPCGHAPYLEKPCR